MEIRCRRISPAIPLTPQDHDPTLCRLNISNGPVGKHHPSRIVCLSAEAVEIIYALGAGNRIVDVTGFAAEPPAARRKPRVSGFSSVNFDKVDALKPDLVITFSDMQAEALKQIGVS